MSTYFAETLHEGIAQRFEMSKVLFEVDTGQQQLIIFDNPQYGRVMALDGVVQTTQADEFIYHEMLTHVPLFSHPNPERVLIIGGGDGGMLRETLKHTQLTQIVQVEIDQAVIEMCRKYLPGHSDGAYDNPRAQIVIDDGLAFVENTEQQFDIIISDSTDPMGPGEALFSEEFYRGCKRCLRPGGILVTQNGVPFFQKDELQNTYKRQTQIFDDCTFFSAAIPSYYGGLMTFAWACDDRDLRQQDPAILRARINAARIRTRYYNASIHSASFALPGYISELIDPATA